MRYRIRKHLSGLYASFIIPQSCVICDVPSFSNIPLCEECLRSRLYESLNRVIDHPEQFCEACGSLLISEKRICMNCRRQEPLQCDKIFTFHPYVATGQRIVSAWKNQGNRGFSEVFAAMIAYFLIKKEFLKKGVVVPIPPRPKKIKQKGWDQMEDVVSYLECFHNISALRLLKRLDGLAQKKLSRRERKTNLINKIFIDTAKCRTIPEVVILIDDIMTTGTTLNSCAEVLKAAGCKQVYGLCLFFD